MRRLLMLVSLVGMAVTAGGCLTLMPVSSHVDRHTNFARYRTYDWGPADALPATDERLSTNPYFVDDVHGAIDIELNRRGLVRATVEPADLVVHYHAAVSGRVEVESPNDPSVAWPTQVEDCVGDNCLPRVTGYEAGTLVIDVLDARTQRLVWRGWAEHRLEDMLDQPPVVRQRVQTAVRRIFETLPMPVDPDWRRTALEGLQ